MYPYGLIGNCQISALVSDSASIDWLCLPRPDSPPIFGKLLDSHGGYFSVKLESRSEILKSQYYLENTNILVTELHSKEGDGIRITDFCPRFEQHGRMYRPIALFRTVEAIAGTPTVSVECKPVNGWQKEELKAIRGNAHLRFDLEQDSVRLITNMSLTYLSEGSSFQLNEKIYFGLTWSFGIQEDIVQMTERFLTQTRDYWRTWVKHCSIPSLFQRETIRSALTLKIHCYEDTGAILAASTTSLPEDVSSERNWDYRYCWLRDAYFALSAFHNLGHFEEMEGFLKFLLAIAHERDEARERLAPVYTLSRGLPLPETIHPNWSGFHNAKPVRSHNQAAEHIQNDVYGEMILTLSPIFFDERFSYLRVRDHEELLEHLALLASRSISKPDAGLWEFRNGWKEHTFTNFMSWAGLERIERIQRLGFLRGIKFDISGEKKRAAAAVERAALDGVIRSGPTDASLDTALSLLPVLRFPNRQACEKTLEQLQHQLCLAEPNPSYFYRYIREDDFGCPRSAFVVCSFWMAQGLAQLGHVARAGHILENVVKSANHLGLFSEHFDPGTKAQLGNFPQAYSHVGLINAAFAVSPRWNEIL